MKQTILSCLIFLALQSKAQRDLKTLIPPAPTTAALGKYGEIPVSPHTGTADISVPLAELSAKDLKLSIQLNYHSGGLKVEELSSWVGLGWSMFAGGVITRQVRGLPDDGPNGFFSNTIDNVDFENHTNRQTLIVNALNGAADFEPDIFYFNLGNTSGRFFYDDFQNRFFTIDKSLKQITYNSPGWEIVTEDGARYYFMDMEVNVGNSACVATSASTVTGWYLTKIVNANKTDSIQFTYQPYFYTLTTFNAVERSFVTEAQEGCAAMGDHFGPETLCYRNSEYNAVRLTEVNSSSGKVKFIASNTERLDLANDYSLNFVEVYNNRNELLYKYKLHQDYFGPPGPGQSPHEYRLRLHKIERLSGGTTEMYRIFEYNNYQLPSRLSFAQDYWGYYNGEAANSHLIPSLVFLTNNGPIFLQGANRRPSSLEMHAQAGMLKKIIYPTGGSTSFEYENHKVHNSFVPNVVPNAVSLDRYQNGPGPVYNATFTINEPPSLLNGKNPSGGNFVNFLIDGITCDYGQTSGMASTGCAVISLSGPIGFTITTNLNNRYLPNGTYTLTIDFSSNTHGQSSWEDFFARVSWNSTDFLNPTASVGGLRIKHLYDFDPVTNKRTREQYFKYHFPEDSTISSAKWDSLPGFSRNIWYREEVPCPSNIPCTITYWCRNHKLTSTSNYPVSGAIGKVTYSFVTVLEDKLGLKGKTTFEYLNPDNLVSMTYPFVPSPDRDHIRGRPKSVKQYKFKDGSYNLVSETVYTYKEPGYVAGGGIKIFKLHQGDDVVLFNGSQDYSNGFSGFIHYENRHSQIIYNDSIISRVYGTDGTSNFQESITKNVISFVDMNVKSVRTKSSDGKTLITYSKHVNDYVTTGLDTMSQAISVMKSRNMIEIPIEQTVWRKNGADSVLVQAKLLLLKNDNGKIVAHKSLSFPASNAFTPSSISGNSFTYDSDYFMDAHFRLYDSFGNIKDAVLRDGVNKMFIWDASGRQVIASVSNAPVTSVFYTSFEDDSGPNISSAAKCGNKSFAGAYTVNMPGTGTRKLTYWSKTGSQAWQLVETTMTTSTTIGGAGTLVDEVRVLPVDAEIISYTYKTGVGVSSTNDTNNKINYYEYDEMGRLKTIRDGDNNILQSYNYHYLTN